MAQAVAVHLGADQVGDQVVGEGLPPLGDQVVVVRVELVPRTQERDWTRANRNRDVAACRRLRLHAAVADRAHGDGRRRLRVLPVDSALCRSPPAGCRERNQLVVHQAVAVHLLLRPASRFAPTGLSLGKHVEVTAPSRAHVADPDPHPRTARQRRDDPASSCHGEPERATTHSAPRQCWCRVLRRCGW